MKLSLIIKVIFLVAVTGLVTLFYQAGGQHYLTLGYVQQSLAQFQEYAKNEPILAVGSYFLIYVTATSLSFPGATILTLLGGALFGALYGTIIVSFASTVGATLAFLGTRYLARDFVIKKIGPKMNSFDEGIKKDGNWYLFSMRLLPVFPFFIVNLAMGLTSISIKNFFVVSQLGMLPGTFVFVNAGKELAQITSLSGILSARLLIAFSLLGLLPMIIKFIVARFKAYKVYANYKKPKSFDYNIAVIGAGSGGLVTAYIAAAIKAKVILIEKHKMGGDCLNTGCIPSKALIRTARFLREQKKSKLYGIEKASVDFNFTDVMSRVKQVIKKIEPHDSIDRYTQLGVECVQAEAQIADPWTITFKDRRITAKNIVVATGAKPRIPDIPGLNKISFVTSDTIWNLKTLPNKFLVLGGGPIGCELAQAFAALGSHVTILETSKKLLGREDADVVTLMNDVFTKEGIKIQTEVKVHSFERLGETNYVNFEKNSVQYKIDFDVVLLAIGREANVQGFGLEKLGIELSDQKTIKTDLYLRTNYPNIYACGDAVGPYQFTHAASHQAWFASVNSLFSPLKKFKINYDHLPWATFTYPEIARIGLNEVDAKEKKIEFEITKYEINDLDRAIADSSDYGFVKVLTVPGHDKILGVTIVADHASEMLPEFVIAMQHGLGLNKILSTIHSYPTMAEANKYAAGVWKKAHAPEKALQYLKKFHNWRRGS